MLGVFKHYILKFYIFNKQKQLDIILNSYDKNNEDLFTTNVTLQYAFQNFIIKTKQKISSLTWFMFVFIPFHPHPHPNL